MMDLVDEDDGEVEDYLANLKTGEFGKHKK